MRELVSLSLALTRLIHSLTHTLPSTLSLTQMPRVTAAEAAAAAVHDSTKELAEQLSVLYVDLHYVRAREEQRCGVSYWTWAWASLSFFFFLLILLLGDAFVHQNQVIAELRSVPGQHRVSSPSITSHVMVSLRHADGQDVMEIELPPFDPFLQSYTVVTWAKGVDDTLLLSVVDPQRHSQHVVYGADCNSSNCVFPYALRILLGPVKPETPIGGTAEERAVAESADLLG